MIIGVGIACTMGAVLCGVGICFLAKCWCFSPDITTVAPISTVGIMPVTYVRTQSHTPLQKKQKLPAKQESVGSGHVDGGTQVTGAWNGCCCFAVVCAVSRSNMDAHQHPHCG